jgi:hypothetical protein
MILERENARHEPTKKQGMEEKALVRNGHGFVLSSS